MKRHFKGIERVENYLKTKEGVLTENTSMKEDFNDWDISITATTKNNLVSTFIVKPNNTYNNNKVCIEFGKIIDGQPVPSGISSCTSDFVILTFYDDRNLYMIKRDKLLNYVFQIQIDGLPKYTSMDKNNCQLSLFDRPSLLNRCIII